MEGSAETAPPARWWIVAGCVAITGVGLAAILWRFPASPWVWTLAFGILIFAVVYYFNPRYRYWRRANVCFGTASALAFVPAIVAKTSIEGIGAFGFVSESSPLAILGFLAAGLYLAWLDSRQHVSYFASSGIASTNTNLQTLNSPPVVMGVIARGNIQITQGISEDALLAALDAQRLTSHVHANSGIEPGDREIPQGSQKQLLALDWSERKKRFCEAVLHSSGKIRTLMSRNADIDLEQIYVPPNIKVQSGVIANASLDSLSSYSEQVMIIGAGGAGKSIFCKSLQLEAARRQESAPVLIRLRHLARCEHEHDLVKGIFDVTNGLGLECTEGEFIEALGCGEIALYLDGFDELASEFRHTLENALSYLMLKIRATKVVITSRPIDGFFNSPTCPIAEILPIDRAKALSLVNRIGLEPKVADQLMLSVSKLFENEKVVISTPLLLTVFAITFDCFGHSLEQRMSLFYERAFDALWIMHDKTKEGFYERTRPTTLSCKEFQEVLGVFSCLTYLNKSLQIYSYSEMIDYLSCSLSAFNYSNKVSANDYLDQLVQSLGLMIQDGVHFEFTHRSFQEYFTAYFFCKSSPQRLTSECGRLLERGSSEMILQFIAQMDPNLFERSVVIPTLDQLIGYSDEDGEGKHKVFAGQIAGAFHAKFVHSTGDKESTSESAETIRSSTNETRPCTVSDYDYFLEMRPEFSSFLSLLRMCFPDALSTLNYEPTILLTRDSNTQLTIRAAWVKAQREEDRELETTRRHREEERDPAQIWLPQYAVEVPELARNLVAAAKPNDSTFLSQGLWQKLCKFRKSLGTKELTTRMQRIESFVFRDNTKNSE